MREQGRFCAACRGCGRYDISSWILEPAIDVMMLEPLRPPSHGRYRFCLRNHVESQIAPPVPLSFVVIDTAALPGCGGAQAVDAFIKKFKLEGCRSSNFKGVCSGALIASVEEESRKSR